MEQSNKKEKSLITAINEMILSKILEVNVSFPAKIKSYDSSTQRATIIPLTKNQYYKMGTRGIQIREEENGGYPELFSMDVAPIPDVPVRWPASDNANCFIHLPLKKGDLGIAHVSTRSLENYLTNEWRRDQECFPLEHNSVRHHDLSDAWFEPGVLPKNKTIQNVNSTDMVIKNNTAEITLYPNNGIKIENNNTKITVEPNGKMKIENNTGDLFAIVKDLITALLSATVTTALPPPGTQQPLDAATLATLTSLQTKILTFI